MQTQLAPNLISTTQCQQAYDIVRACVHCGFCNATCPTYRLLGDELDGPRGRIYLIKQALEGGDISARSLSHLDRCLYCQSCETTCPSGVQFTQLLDIGRHFAESKVKRSLWQKLTRHMLNIVLPSRFLFHTLYRVGKLVRPVLPGPLKRLIPNSAKLLAWPHSQHATHVGLFDGCVQASVAPHINTAAAQVLDRLQVSASPSAAGGCCGALSFHLNETDTAMELMKTNIDAWWQQLQSGCEAIIVTASGCSTFIKQYARLLGEDRQYAEKAQRVLDKTMDIAEYLRGRDLSMFRDHSGQAIALHSPCSLQHGLKLHTTVKNILHSMQCRLTEVKDEHLCCGSAGSYSLLQPKIAQQLLLEKITALTGASPDVIATANIGCLLHIQKGTKLPVKHWIEILAESPAIAPKSPT